MDGRNSKVTLEVVVALTMGASLIAKNLERIYVGSGFHQANHVFLMVTFLLKLT